MQKIAIFAALLFLSACVKEELSPKQKEERSMAAVKLFADACVAHRGDTAKISAWAALQKAQTLTDEEVKQLPLGMMELDLTNAWKIEQNGAVYYLSLAPNSCSVKTEKADENTVRSQFMALVQSAPQGLNTELRSEQSTQSPFPFHQLAYAWRAEGQPEEWVLTANTSPSDQLPAQAALSLTQQVYQRTPLLNSNP